MQHILHGKANGCALVRCDASTDGTAYSEFLHDQAWHAFAAHERCIDLHCSLRVDTSPVEWSCIEVHANKLVNSAANLCADHLRCPFRVNGLYKTSDTCCKWR